ncbi:peroxisome biogenesis factor 10 [Tieghemiomyces parasiticus]|uniref:RING-type E3 ubiquitin transferase n=1 Tax=Tieghemiomyces parasiticus TaxID=78921 RepID=A0A9W8E2W1_9FUNG|nr:peroxisome biogenesis factor 10 [Tieghemiomyces parasiticus]
MSATVVAPPVPTLASEDTLPQAHTSPSAQRQQLLRSLQPRWDYGSQPDIIRSNQKDLHYQNVTHDTIKSAIQQHLGIRFVVRNQKAIQLVSKLIYYTTTTIQGAQTLGEEYCSIMQVDRHSMTYPTLLRRTVLVLFNTFGADLLTRTVRRMHVHFRELAQTKEWCDVLAENFTAVHLMIFYFVGSYYDVSKRLTGIRYQISTRKIGPYEIRGGYEILGVLLAIQLVVKLGYTVQDMLTCRSKGAVSTRGIDNDDRQCYIGDRSVHIG